ncbi:MAG: S1-like domain-containing RNA-binding protein [Bacteroidales bacterium]|nr:S1-like domain-containing RNA-binding protein [Bacteroidales bacterium]MDD3160953.1 S1-like domain-containing RNA-binding protein [Bacteroidales bacterium]
MMAELGKYNTLTIAREVDFGVYLDASEGIEILMPSRYLPSEYQIGDTVNVFVYRDSEDRLIATTETPFAQVGDFVFLEVVGVSAFGAFLDWGLLKDLFVPHKEQKAKMQLGGKYLVYIYIDEETDRITASAKIDRYVSKETPPFNPGDKVDLLIYQFSDLGYKAIINNRYGGMLYEDETFRHLPIGCKTTGYIKQVREDNKIDLLLDEPGYGKVGGVSEEILNYLETNDGYLALNDKSPSEDIYEAFGVSKKTFKKAIGDLYKRRLITIEQAGIRKTKN